MSIKKEKIEEKIKKFEQAFIPEKASLILPAINSIILALDAHDWIIESSRYSYRVAGELSQRFDSDVQIICMAVNKEEYNEAERLVEEALDHYKNININANGSCIIGSPSENILKFAQKEKHDLIILPSPYAERVEKDNLDSLGATVEILINRSKLPLLLLTESNILPEKIIENLVIPIQGNEDIVAAEWVLYLADQNSTIKILNIVRKE
ncbi:MAG: universal stress protein, partial [Candidatus Kariarchaeaceae archaeon]